MVIFALLLSCLQPAQPPVVLTGRALTPAGTPLASQPLAAAMLIDGREIDRESGTDLDGRFTFVVIAHDRTPTLQALRLTHAKWSARLASARPLTPGTHDLGKLQLTVPPLLANGVVVDAQGLPRPEAIVGVQWSEMLEQSESPQQLSPLISGVEIDRYDHGVFALRGWLPQAPLAVFAHAHGYLAAPALPLGDCSQDLRLVLLQGSALQVTLGVPADLPNGRIRAFLIAEESPADAGPAPPASLRRSTTETQLVWRGLTPGAYRLDVLLADADPDAPTLRQKIALRSTVTHKLRLDVGASLRRFVLELRDHAGRPLDGYGVRLEEDLPEAERRIEFVQGRAIVRTVRTEVRLSVHAEEHLPAEVTVAGDLRIQLKNR